ncbi:DUF2730 family protein [Shewanella sp. WXL01]|uniref:DUF2730 family protein n=1 Tax=Shewanella sp. WXL01 TaxID=2709721 RepID=UPI0014384AD0|nr:DUF2730 family protein [Shewanella sp. WXL01]
MAEFVEFINVNFKWISAVVYLAFVGLFAWFHIRFTPRKDHDQLSNKVSDHAEQLTKVQADMKHLPTKEEVHRLDKTLSGLTETISATQEGVTRLERKTDMLLENELRND